MLPIRRFTVFMLAVWLVTAGCSSGTYVRHLASDASLLTPQQSTKQEVIGYLGPPDKRVSAAEGEKWIYYQRHRSLLRRMPYLGDKMGSEDYESLIISFNGDLVKTCVYRTYDEQEFDAGIGRNLKDSKSASINSESVDKK